jgi:hypothetical protein
MQHQPILIDDDEENENDENHFENNIQLLSQHSKSQSASAIECIICMESCDATGTHRLSCLPCGNAC